MDRVIKRVVMAMVVAGLIVSSIALPAYAASDPIIYAESLDNGWNISKPANWTTALNTHGRRFVRSNGTAGSMLAVYHMPQLTVGRRYRMEYYIANEGAYTGSSYWFRAAIGDPDNLQPDLVLMDTTTTPQTVQAARVEFTAFEGGTLLMVNMGVSAAHSPNVTTYGLYGVRIWDITNEEVVNAIDNQTGKIGQWFSELGSSIGQWFADLGSSITDAGSDSPDLDTEMSWMDEVVDTVNGWLDTLNGFSESVKTAGTETKQYIQQGTSVFTEFYGTLPTIVVVLIGFAVVFVVVRKIVGR